MNERGDGVGSEFNDAGAQESSPGPSAVAVEALGTLLPSPHFAARGANSATAAATTPQQQQSAQQQQPQSAGVARARSKYDDDVARKYGWAESWLELSVLPCFPETAVAGPVSLARWFADPRVILFNKVCASEGALTICDTHFDKTFSWPEQLLENGGGGGRMA